MDSDVAPLPAFPPAQQAQIIRANQRDLFYVSSLREQAENVLRAWLGNRWLSRWDKEVDLLAKLLYYGLSTGRAAQTLGEEYTDTWQYSERNRGFPSPRRRAALVFLPAFPAYIISRFATTLSGGNEKLLRILYQLPGILDVLSEINLAAFYFSGVYYDLVRRFLRIRNVSSIPENPNARPPSYSLLGILIAIRLIHRLVSTVRSFRADKDKGELSQTSPRSRKEVKGESSTEATIDGISLSELMAQIPDENDPAVPAEEDEHTALDFASISAEERERRNCTLCLEERTASCATECGHMFCWSCIIGWGREKAECPLCRQSLNLARLIPIYNL